MHYGDSQQYVHIISIGSTGPCMSEGFPWAEKNSCDDGRVFDGLGSPTSSIADFARKD